MIQAGEACQDDLPVASPFRGEGKQLFGNGGSVVLLDLVVGQFGDAQAELGQTFDDIDRLQPGDDAALFDALADLDRQFFEPADKTGFDVDAILDDQAVGAENDQITP